MKIGLVHDPYSPISLGNVGGEDNLVELEVTQLEARGHEVQRIMRILDGGRRRFIHGIVTASGRGISPIDKKSIDSLDLIHTNNLSLVSGYSWIDKSRVPVVSSFHNYRPLCPISISWRDGNLCFECRDVSSFKAVQHRCGGVVGLLGSIRKGVLQRNEPEIQKPSHLIFTSNKMAAAYQATTKISNFDILHNPSRFKTTNNSSKTLSLSATPPKGFLFAGRLTPEKGVIELIEKWPEQEPLTIAGSGVLESKVRKLCDSRQNIKFYGTFSPHDHNFYGQFEALIFPSSWLEGSPLVVIEAISMGVPIIATDTSSATELIEQSQCGITIPQNYSTEEIRIAISRLRKNSNIFRRNGLVAGETIFSPDTWIKNLESIFERVLRNKVL
jgi:glycosyltransferase involved in cell wall biosynthesis